MTARGTNVRNNARLSNEVRFHAFASTALR